MNLSQHNNLTIRFLILCALGILLHGNAMAAEGVMKLNYPPPSAQLSQQAEQVCGRLYQLASKQAHYLISLLHPWEKKPEWLLLTDSKSGEHWIRPNTGTIAGLCFLYRFGPYDEDMVGLSREALLQDKILPMMRYIVATHKTGTHVTNDGKPWGDAWQSAHWAQMIGRGAWWIWDDLPEDVQTGVRKVAAHEADRFVDKAPPHQIQNDTKAEENAWNSQILSVAMLLMPNDTRFAQWEDAFQKWVLSSFLRPADEESQKMIDGRTVAQQYTGANVHDDFTLENHGFVHPDYMSTFSLSLGNILDYEMSNRQAPQALFYNVKPIYQNLKWFAMPDGGFIYPSGQDWTLFRSPYWLFTNTLMTLYLQDPKAWTLFNRCLTTTEKMQARSEQGNIFNTNEYFFPSTQSDTLFSLAKCWLAFQSGRSIQNHFTEPRGVLKLDAGEILLHRTPTAAHSVSWGKKIMAQVVPNRLDRIVSPHLRNGFGWIHLKGDDGHLPLSLHDIKVKHQQDKFEVTMKVNHGNNKVRSTFTFISNSDGSAIWKETLTALDDITVKERATGLIGILNNDIWVYENGQRKLKIDDETIFIPSKSGDIIDEEHAQMIVVDDCIKIESKESIPVRYISSENPSRGRVTDLLILNHSTQEQRYKEGESLSSYKFRIEVE